MIDKMTILKPFSKKPESFGVKGQGAKGKEQTVKGKLARFYTFNYVLFSFLEKVPGELKYFRLRLLLPSALCLLTFFTSCKDTFEPFQENDKFFFTMYGFLDAAADTQWVRIAPVRGTFDAPPEIPDMEIFIDDLENGSTIEMNKILVQFGNQFNVINAWTDREIISGQTYRVRAKNPNGNESQVVVSIPDPFPVPKLLTVTVPGSPPDYFLIIDEVEHLADVQSRWHYRESTPFWEEERYFVFSLKSDAIVVGTNEGSYMVKLKPDDEKEYIMNESLVLSIPGGEIEFLENQIYTASAGPEWDDNISSIDDLVYTLPDGFSNIENGLGYMVGIYSRNIPFRTCLNEARELVPCPEVKPFW